MKTEIETLETRIQNWIEEQTRIAKEIQYELNAIEREERDIDFGKIRKLAYEADVYETLIQESQRQIRTLQEEALEVDVRTLQTGVFYAPEEDNRSERVKEKENNLTKLILDIIKTLSTPEDIDWVHIEDLVIEAERLDSEIKEEK